MTKTNDLNDSRHPASKIINSNLGKIDLTIAIEKDMPVLNQFKNFSGLIAFIATIRRGTAIVGIGHGSTLLNQQNRYMERGIAIARNTAIINAVMMSTKMLDALSVHDITEEGKVTPRVQNNTRIGTRKVEGNSIQTLSDDKSTRFASEKQRTFLKSLIETKCDNSAKSEYLSQLSQPQLSSFQCSELISSLLPL